MGISCTWPYLMGLGLFYLNFFNYGLGLRPKQTLDHAKFNLGTNTSVLTRIEIRLGVVWFKDILYMHESAKNTL